MVRINPEKLSNDTPYFLLNQDELDKNIANAKKALQTHWSNYHIGYSFKTNSLPWICRYVNSKNLFAEVVSETELELARKTGYSDDRIIYNGPKKNYEGFSSVLEHGGIVNIDSQRELEYLNRLDKVKHYSVGLRVNYNLEKQCPGETSAGEEGGRFGFCLENGELGKAIEKVRKLPNVEIAGLHLHASSKTRSISIYQSHARIACQIQRQYNLNLRYIDVGGGFFGGLADKPQYEDYITAIADELKATFFADETTLIIEPGASLIASPVSYVCKVIDIKDTTYGRFVITDGSRIHIDPLMHKSKYFITTSSKKNPLSRQIICGFTCMEGDRITELTDAAELSVGDTLTFDKVGSYTMCLSPLFIEYFPPVYLQTEEGIEEIRRRWTVDDVLR